MGPLRPPPMVTKSPLLLPTPNPMSGRQPQLPEPAWDSASWSPPTPLSATDTPPVVLVMLILPRPLTDLFALHAPPQRLTETRKPLVTPGPSPGTNLRSPKIRNTKTRCPDFLQKRPSCTTLPIPRMERPRPPLNAEVLPSRVPLPSLPVPPLLSVLPLSSECLFEALCC